MAIACALAIAAAATPSAHATPGQDLINARTEFRSGNYALSISLLSALLYPKNQLTDQSEIAEAHLLLGVAHLETGNIKGADQEFEEALFIDSTLKLDPLLFSTRAVDAFERKKEALDARLRAEEKALLEAKRAEKYRLAMENMVVIEKRDYYVNFLPFGSGQFQNGHRKKGISIAIAQAVLGGTSLALYGFQVFRYGFPGDVPLDEVGLVNAMQVAQIGTGIAFYGVYAYGVIDSLMYFQPTIERKPDKQYLDQVERDEGDDNSAPAAKSPVKKPESSLRLFPSAGPSSVGLGVSWEF